MINGLDLAGLRAAQKCYLSKAGGKLRTMTPKQERQALDAATRAHLVKRAVAAYIFEGSKDSTKLLARAVANHFAKTGDDGTVRLRPIYGRVDTAHAMPVISLYGDDDTVVAKFRYTTQSDKLARAG